LTNGEDGYIVYPHYKHHPEIQQPLEHTTVRVEVQLGAPVPEGMTGSVHLAWYDPNNTVANRSTPAQSGHGTRDNGEDMVLGTAGDPLPGFTLNFKVKPPKERGPETMDRRLTSYLTVADARYGDNFIVVGHPHEDIEKTYEFRENASQQLVLMHPENTGLWKELPNGKDESGELDPTVPDLQTSILTIFPSVDIDCDSDNTGARDRHGIERSDLEEQIENEADYPGKRVPFNNNDDNGNDIEDWLENAEYEYPAGLSWAPFTDLDLVPVVLDRGFADLTGMGGFVFELKVTIDRGLRYWQVSSVDLVPNGAVDSVFGFPARGHVWDRGGIRNRRGAAFRPGSGPDGDPIVSGNHAQHVGNVNSGVGRGEVAAGGKRRTRAGGEEPKTAKRKCDDADCGGCLYPGVRQRRRSGRGGPGLLCQLGRRRRRP
ncbi:MAG: hypothetical protein QM844_19265, partial [Planctomycetota bacterium]|nr:hypothetical protein [Planctomycetota bacterium]